MDISPTEKSPTLDNSPTGQKPHWTKAPQSKYLLNIFLILNQIGNTVIDLKLDAKRLYEKYMYTKESKSNTKPVEIHQKETFHAVCR